MVGTTPTLPKRVTLPVNLKEERKRDCCPVSTYSGRVPAVLSSSPSFKPWALYDQQELWEYGPQLCVTVNSMWRRCKANSDWLVLYVPPTERWWEYLTCQSREMDSILCKEKGKRVLERKKRVAFGYKRVIQWLASKEKRSGPARVWS